MRKPFKCPLCEHENPPPADTKKSHVIVACAGCRGKITITPKRLGGWRWPKIVGKPRAS